MSRALRTCARSAADSPRSGAARSPSTIGATAAGGDPRQVLGSALGRAPDQDGDLRAAARELGDEPAADQAGGSGDEGVGHLHAP
jgi:hypothetical protein